MKTPQGGDKSGQGKRKPGDEYERENGVCNLLWSALRQTSRWNQKADGTPASGSLGGCLRQQEKHVSSLSADGSLTLGRGHRGLSLSHSRNSCNPWRGGSPRSVSACHGDEVHQMSSADWAQVFRQDKINIRQVWIHGGSWLTGSGGPVVYNPDFFMDKVFTDSLLRLILRALFTSGWTIDWEPWDSWHYLVRWEATRVSETRWGSWTML